MQKIRIQHIKRVIAITIINVFFSGTHFWSIKRGLLRFGGATIGKNAKIVGPIHFTCHLTIGENSWIGVGFSAHGNGTVRIGDNCDLAPEVMLLTGSHEIGDHNRRAGRGMSSIIEIGNGCWLGARSTVLGAINIGDGCVIAAGSIVNKSFEPDWLIAGVPANGKRSL